MGEDLPQSGLILAARITCLGALDYATAIGGILIRRCHGDLCLRQSVSFGLLDDRRPAEDSRPLLGLSGWRLCLINHEVPTFW
jgi:hypothetical protein